MYRRDFLKLAFLLGGTLVLSQCDGLDKDETIIVIGAGVSGLSAAHNLQKRGYKVIVLEARNRIGGRIHTSRDWADDDIVIRGASQHDRLAEDRARTPTS